MADKKVSSVSAKPVSANAPTTAATHGQSNAANVSRRPSSSTRPGSSHPINLFSKENYIWMLAGLVMIAIGMFLMSGGKSNDPAVFDQKEVYSATRITIAPLLIIIGLGLEVFAIFRKPAK